MTQLMPVNQTPTFTKTSMIAINGITLKLKQGGLFDLSIAKI